MATLSLKKPKNLTKDEYLVPADPETDELYYEMCKEEPATEETSISRSTPKKRDMSFNEKSAAAKAVIAHFLENAANSWMEVDPLTDGYIKDELEQINTLVQQFTQTLLKKYRTK